MECNCNDKKRALRHVQGNTLSLAIALQAKETTFVDGVKQVTVSDYVPEHGDEITVVLESDRKKRYEYTGYKVSVQGNMVTMQDDGTLPVGTYGVEVDIVEAAQGVHRRFYQETALVIVKATKDAISEQGVEFDSTLYSLDAMLQLGLRGSDGKTAYQTWLDQGHEGSEDDFLDWLRTGALLLQETGQNTEAVMSQKAITDAIGAVRTELNAKQFEAGVMTFDDAPTEDSENLLRSGAVYDSEDLLRQADARIENKIDTLIDGQSAIVRTIGGYKLYKDGFFYAAASYKTVIYDVTPFVGKRVSVTATNANQSVEYMLVKDHTTMIDTTNTTYVTEEYKDDFAANNLLVKGSATSGSSSNQHTATIYLTQDAVTEQAEGGGEVYLIITLWHTLTATPLLLVDGIDDRLARDKVPTKDSERLVESGGVYKEFEELYFSESLDDRNVFSGIGYVTAKDLDGGKIHSLPAGSTNHRLRVVNLSDAGISVGDYLKLYTTNSSATDYKVQIAFFDDSLYSNGAIVDNCPAISGTYKKFTAVAGTVKTLKYTTQVPNGAIYVVAYYHRDYTASLYTIRKKSDILLDRVSTIEETISDIDSVKYYSRTLYMPMLETGKYIDARSDSETYGQAISITGRDTAMVSGFVPMMGADKISFSMSTLTTGAEAGIAGIVAYDASKNPIATIKIVESGSAMRYETIVAEVPSGAEYIRMHVYFSRLTTEYAIKLLYKAEKFAQSVWNDTYLVPASKTYGNNYSGNLNRAYDVRESSSTFGQMISATAGQRASAAIDVSNVEYVQCQIRAFSNGYTDLSAYGSIFTHEDVSGVQVVEVVSRISEIHGVNNSTYKISPIWKVPPGATHLRITNYNTSSYTVRLFNKSNNVRSAGSSVGGDLSTSYFNQDRECALQQLVSTSKLKLLHFSDLHGDKVRLQRLVDWANSHGTYINDVLNTGDTVAVQYTNANRYTEVSGAGNILTVIGNHDTSTQINSSTYDHTAHAGVDAYNKFIKPYISYTNDSDEVVDVWGVTQPSDAEEYGKCYYYKDYASAGIRLVCVDIMKYDSSQRTWVASVLEDARTSNLSVVVATHIVPTKKNAIPTSFCSHSDITKSEIISGTDNQYLPVDVQSFIDAGGEFICYLTGHHHSDRIFTANGYPDQLGIMVCCASCNVNATAYGKNRVEGTRSEDDFNIVSIDKANHRITLIKIGSDCDYLMQHVNWVMIDYLSKSEVAFVGTTTNLPTVDTMSQESGDSYSIIS